MDILKWKWTVRFSCGNVTNRNAQSANFHPYILSNYLFRVTSIWYSECLLFILVSKIRHYLILNHISLSLNSNPEASPEISESSQTETVLVLEVRLVTTEGEGEMALIGCPLEPGTRTLVSYRHRKESRPCTRWAERGSSLLFISKVFVFKKNIGPVHAREC